MLPPRTCPHCKKQIGIDEGFLFDKSLNLICRECDKIMYPSNWEGENKFDDSRKTPKSSVFSKTLYFPPNYRPPTHYGI